MQGELGHFLRGVHQQIAMYIERVWSRLPHKWNVLRCHDLRR
jgi:hypothetical protein